MSNRLTRIPDPLFPQICGFLYASGEHETKRDISKTDPPASALPSLNRQYNNQTKKCRQKLQNKTNLAFQSLVQRRKGASGGLPC